MLSRTQQWQRLFLERIYQLCNGVHPGMSIDKEAVSHIRHLVGDVVRQLLDGGRPTTLTDLEKTVHTLLPQLANSIIKDATEFINSWPPKKQQRNYNSANIKTLHELNSKLVLIIKEHLGLKEKEKKEREKETERMALFLVSLCDFLTEDILKWAGHYVKNVRNGAMNISLQNLKIALNADKNLMELTEAVQNGDEESEGISLAGTTLLFDIDWNLDEDRKPPQRVDADYGKVAREFLHYETQYLSSLSLIVNVLRRRFEPVCTGNLAPYLDEIFGNIDELHDLSLQVERCLEDAIEMCDTPSVGSTLWPLAEGHDFDCYVDFLELITGTMPEAVTKLLKEPRLQTFLQGEERTYSALQNGQTFHLIVAYVLPSLLQLPIVHFYRSVEFLKKLYPLSCSEEDHIDLQNIIGYFDPLVAKIDGQLTTELRRLIKCDREQRQLNDSPISQLERLQQLQKRIDGYEGKNIGQTCTELIKEGSLQMVRPSLSMQTPESLRRGRHRILTDRFVFVFDQLVVMCKPHKNGLKFKERINIRKTEMRDVEDSEELKNAFRIESVDKTHNVLQAYTFVCRTKSDKDSWMTALLNLQTKSILDRLLDNYTTEEKKRIPLIIPDAEQYKFADPDTEDNIMFEDYTSSSGVPVVKKGTVVKLVERLTYHLYTDNNYVKTFLISFRSFCSPTELLSLLMQRFDVPQPARLTAHSNEMRPGGPLAGRYDTVQSHGLSSPPPYPIHGGVYSEQSFQRFRKEYERPIQRRVLSVLQQWVKVHWYDFDNDPQLLKTLEDFLNKSCHTPAKLTNQHRKFAKIILSTIEKRKCANLMSSNAGNTLGAGHTNGAFENDDGVPLPASPSTPNVNCFQKKPPEILWHTAGKGDVQNYDLLTLHPVEIARQLTILHFDLFKAIKPIEMVGSAWMEADKMQKSPQLLRLVHHSNDLTYWLARSILDTDSQEERMALLARSLEVMCVFEELHNFTGLVAFFSALNTTYILRLTYTWERLEQHYRNWFDGFKELCDTRWQQLKKRLQSVDPPCIPFTGVYMDHIFKLDTAHKTVFKPKVEPAEMEGGPTSLNTGKVLVSFMKCRKIAALISEVQMYQNQPYALNVEPSIQQFFESIAPQEEFKDEDALLEYLYSRSHKMQPKDGPKPPEVKSKHGPHVLKSPGIKPPKGNHYSRDHPTHNLPPTTPSPLDDGSRASPSHSGIARSSGEDFAIIHITPGQQPRHIADVARRQHANGANFPLGPVPTAKKSAAPPPLHPRKLRPEGDLKSPSVMAPLLRQTGTASPPHPHRSPRLNHHAQAFIFPEPTPAAPQRLKPPAPPPVPASTSSEHRVTLPTTSPRGGDGDSACVSVSLPPPQLPPRLSRPGSSSTPPPVPPPRPPKPGHLSTSPLVTPKSAVPQKTPPAVEGQSEGPSPPPLPPKTYKTRRQSSSPTN